ncbi:MAG TPA: hypothetical protein VN201_10010, partial [Roseateles sp.]|nr:hypothetical protein [Roseateles sp.]
MNAHGQLPKTATRVTGVEGAGALDPDQHEKAPMAIGARLLGLTRGDDALGTLRSVCRHPAQRQDLFASMHYLLVAYLGL